MVSRTIWSHVDMRSDALCGNGVDLAPAPELEFNVNQRISILTKVHAILFS